MNLTKINLKEMKFSLYLNYSRRGRKKERKKKDSCKRTKKRDEKRRPFFEARPFLLCKKKRPTILVSEDKRNQPFWGIRT